jgi:acyl carrier protein
MDDTTILDRLLTLFEQYAPRAALVGRPPDEVHLQHLHISSAEMINLVVEIEDTFELEVRDEYVHTLVTLGDVVRAVAARLPRDATPGP